MSAGFNNVPECPTPVRLAIKGRLPHWLSGTLYRTGPGTFSVPTKSGKTYEIQHWFDGLAQHHRFEITPGENAQAQPTVIYNSRNAAKADYEYIKEHGSWDTITFGQDTCKTLFRRFFSLFLPSTKDFGQNVAVTMTPNFPPIGKATEKIPLMAKTDANALAFLDPETLEIERVSTYAEALPELSGPLSGAHSCRDNGVLYNYVLDFGAKATYKVFAIDDATGKGTILATINDAPGAYLHSIGLTERYVVLSIWQCDYSLGVLSVPLNQNLVNSFKPWDSGRKTVFYLIDRYATDGKGVRARVTAPPIFVFHTVNAYDDGDSVVIDLATYPDNRVASSLKVNDLRSIEAVSHAPLPNLTRYRLPTTSPRGRAEVLYTLRNAIELPVVGTRFHHRPYRLAYGIHATPAGRKAGLWVDAIAKIDVETQQMTLWAGRAAEVPGEPIFVATPDAKEEDDGVLLTVVFDLARGKSALVCLDARTMEESGRAELEQVVPYGFHGAFNPKPARSISLQARL